MKCWREPCTGEIEWLPEELEGTSCDTRCKSCEVYDSVGSYFGICGCVEHLTDILLEALRFCALESGREKSEALFALLPDENGRLLALCVLDKAQMVEHGSNIAYSWPTAKGKELLEFWEQRPEWRKEVKP